MCKKLKDLQFLMNLIFKITMGNNSVESMVFKRTHNASER